MNTRAGKYRINVCVYNAISSTVNQLIDWGGVTVSGQKIEFLLMKNICKL